MLVSLWQIKFSLDKPIKLDSVTLNIVCFTVEANANYSMLVNNHFFFSFSVCSRPKDFFFFQLNSARKKKIKKKTNKKINKLHIAAAPVLLFCVRKAQGTGLHMNGDHRCSCVLIPAQFLDIHKSCNIKFGLKCSGVWHVCLDYSCLSSRTSQHNVGSWN